MADTGTGTGLSTIFAIFLGLMVTAFVGVGVYTFYPPPRTLFEDRLTDLDRRHQAVAASKAPDQLTAEDRAEMQRLTDERNALMDQSREATEVWGFRTSLILIVLATLAMAVSLVRAATLPVVSSGLLLGGVFTMVYGTGWIVATDTSLARFFVITAALAITIALGYVRFVRQAGSAVVTAGAGAAGVPGDIEARVRRIEQRLDDAANALTRDQRTGRS
ncbi:MAG: hypothetical protein AB7O28_08920 [Vicinamibacterales bacterium]